MNLFCHSLTAWTVVYYHNESGFIGLSDPLQTRGNGGAAKIRKTNFSAPHSRETFPPKGFWKSLPNPRTYQMNIFFRSTSFARPLAPSWCLARAHTCTHAVSLCAACHASRIDQTAVPAPPMRFARNRRTRSTVSMVDIWSQEAQRARSFRPMPH